MPRDQLVAGFRFASLRSSMLKCLYFIYSDYLRVLQLLVELTQPLIKISLFIAPFPLQ